MALSFTRDSDIPAMFADSPHTITVGEITRPCWFDDFEEVLEGERRSGPEISRVARATVQTSAFPNIAIGDEVVISDTESENSETFIVFSKARGEDGALTDLILRSKPDDES